MKKNLSDYLVALTVILCSLVLLGALTYALSGGFIRKSDRTLDIDYPDVTGVKLNAEVRYAGAPAGSVTRIRLLTFAEREAADTEQRKRNAVRVTVKLSKDIPPLPEDVEASLSSDTMLSEKFIALSAGTPSAPPLAKGVVLQGQSGGGLDGLVAKIGPLAESVPRLVKAAEDILDGMKPLLKETREAVVSVHQVVNDIGPRANNLLEGLKKASDSADEAIKNVNKLVDGPTSPVKTDLAELKEALMKMQSTLGTANQMILHTDKSVDGRMQELSVVLQNLKVATTHAKALTQALGERPNRLIFSGKPQKLPTEEEIIKATKPVPGVKP